MKTVKKNIQSEEDRWVDVHDDSAMIELGFRNPIVYYNKINAKTPYERKLLKTLRHLNKEDMHFGITPTKHIPVRAKLIIYLKKNNKYPKTTYSTECWQHEIPSILADYRIGKNGMEESAILKYSFNGRTYAPSEVPFWR